MSVELKEVWKIENTLFEVQEEKFVYSDILQDLVNWATKWDFIEKSIGTVILFI